MAVASHCAPIVDRHTGEIRDAQVFVGVLGASSYTYAEATHTQSLPDWIASHQRMLRFFGGVPELLVPDNLKAAVTRACRYAPKINATYTELAAHYGTAVLPARPYKPRDKPQAGAVAVLGERTDPPAAALTTWASTCPMSAGPVHEAPRDAVPVGLQGLLGMCR